MADKLMRTVVVMSFFLILALFSSCGTNDSSPINADNGGPAIVHPVDAVNLTIEH